MPLRLYLDDDTCSKKLAALLRDAGHHVVIPADANFSGFDDDVHFRYSISNDLMVVTRNAADFRALHYASPTHPGIIVICQDNDPSRDMNYQEIVAAIQSLERAFDGHPGGLANQVHELNQWRGQYQSPANTTSASPPATPPPSQTTKRRKTDRKKKLP